MRGFRGIILICLWDCSELWCADINAAAGNITITNTRKLVGNGDESIVEPRWRADGTLFFVSDRSNWWNLYQVLDNKVADEASGAAGEASYADAKIKNILPMSSEFASPTWVHGISSWAFYNDKILASYNENGFWYLALLSENKANSDLAGHNNSESNGNDKSSAAYSIKMISIEGVSFSQIRVAQNSAVFIRGFADSDQEISRLNLNNIATDPIPVVETLAVATTAQPLSPVIAEQYNGFISSPCPIEFPSTGDRIGKALYYHPTNANYKELDGTLPPLIVEIHGGPTACASPEFKAKRQFWTSRGFAVVDVNYAGSTGFGREYRQLLQNNWGIVDIEDCESVAKYLVAEKLVDPKKLIIHGGSAGGYTTLAALTFKDTFAAGASYYGVSDLAALAQETHKFESRYLDGLIGPYPEKKDFIF